MSSTSKPDPNDSWKVHRVTEISTDLRTLMHQETEELKTLNSIFGAPPAADSERVANEAEDVIEIVDFRLPPRERVKHPIGQHLKAVNRELRANHFYTLPMGWNELLTEHAWANPGKAIRQIESYFVDVEGQSQKDTRVLATILTKTAQDIIRQEKAAIQFLG